ncbi:MAG: hypothetical protein LBB13_03155 [Rickettsiales bacterium]|jgi:hypothetical protein|nr:hypothetical protein [Rickettsiales bacterium]
MAFYCVDGLLHAEGESKEPVVPAVIDGYSPTLEGKVLFKYIADGLLKGANGKEGEGKQLSFLDIYSSPKLIFNKHLSMNSALEYRPVSKRAGGNGEEGYLSRKNYLFSGYGLLIPRLNFEYREEQFMFGIGKFDPSFSEALSSKRYYGILGTNIVDEYQLTEKVGFYVAMILPMLNLRFNFFKNDSSFLSRSIINDRGANSSRDNIGSASLFENFSLTVNLKMENNCNINMGFRRMISANSEKEAENGYVIGGEGIIEETNESLGMVPAIEVVLLNNYTGDPHKNAGFLSVNTPFYYGRWSFGFGLGGKVDFVDRLKDVGYGVLFQGSIGYELANGLAIDISRKYEKNSYFENGSRKKEDLSSWGIGISYSLKL